MTEVPERLRKEVEATLASAAQALKTQLAASEGELQKLQREMDKLRADRQYLITAIRKLDPEFTRGAKGPKPQSNGAVDPVKLERVRAYIKEHGREFENGFTATDIWEGMMPAEKEMGTIHRVGRTTTVRAMHELHEQGFVRVDRVTVGGFHAYKPVGNG